MKSLETSSLIGAGKLRQLHTVRAAATLIALLLCLGVLVSETVYANTEIPLSIGSRFKGYPAISENRVVYQDDRTRDYRIFLYDLTTRTEIQIGAMPGQQGLPDIYKDKVVWLQLDPGQFRLK